MPRRLLVFTRTAGYRHDSIEAGVRAFAALAAQAGRDLDVTESDAELARRLDATQAVVFLNTSGTVLDDGARAALAGFVRRGGGFLGVHAACDTEYEWPFYRELVGAYFRAHPLEIQEARVVIEDAGHAATRGLPRVIRRKDEWYDFDASPRGTPGLRVLATLDEASYQGGTMGADHPIAWCHERCGGPAFYTGLGHTEEGFDEPFFRAHLGGALAYVLGYGAG